MVKLSDVSHRQFIKSNHIFCKIMKVRNFIISNTRDQNNFFELFKTEDPSMGCVTRVFEPFVLVENEYEPVQLNSVDLPVEIVSIILEKLFENYLEDQEIGLACKLAYVSKLYFYNFYSHHVGKPPLGYKHLQVAIYRYCKTFKTMLLLLDASQCELPYDEGRNVCYSLNYSKGVTMCDGSTFAPYNFSDTEIEVTNCFTDMILANDRHSHLKPFTNGTSVYDTVWMVGAGFEIGRAHV